MRFDVKSRRNIEEYIANLESQGIPRRMIVPPAYRLLWRVRLYVRPPLSNGFWTNTIIIGSMFGFSFGVAMVVLLHVLDVSGLSAFWIAVSCFLLPGIAFGLSMSAYLERKRRGVDVPPW